MPTEFYIVENLSSSRFQEEVNEKLKDGWELHGDMKAYPYKRNEPDEILYIQALIKNDGQVLKRGGSGSSSIG